MVIKEYAKMKQLTRSRSLQTIGSRTNRSFIEILFSMLLEQGTLATKSIWTYPHFPMECFFFRFYISLSYYKICVVTRANYQTIRNSIYVLEPKQLVRKYRSKNDFLDWTLFIASFFKYCIIVVLKQVKNMLVRDKRTKIRLFLAITSVKRK